jgi:hypothetical protein
MDEIEVLDQRDLNYILFCLQNETPVTVEILPKSGGAARGMNAGVQYLLLFRKQIGFIATTLNSQATPRSC